MILPPSPHPPIPLPGGKGEIFSFLMQGASPLASPGAGWDAALDLLVESGLRRGSLPSLSPADAAFSLLCCPHLPNPLPLRGRGRPRLFQARGFAPCIPGGWVGCGSGFACGKRVTAGGLLSLPPAAPAFSLLCCPPSPKGKDIPPTRARRALFPSGEGGDQGYFRQGASPLASPGLNPGGTG